MAPIKKCKFCKGNSFKHMYDLADRNLDISGEFSLDRCLACGVVWTGPQLSDKDFEKYYPKDYYSFDEVRTNESCKVRWRLNLYDIYYNELGGNNLLRVLCSPIKFLIRGTKIYPGKKLLDIGCGSGQFLYEMRACGMEVYGVEPAASVKGEFDLDPDLIKAKYKEESFDLITMNHVLQHVNNPKEMIKEVHRVLKQDGLFIVSASNMNSLAAASFRKDWFQLDVPRHLFNLSDKMLMRFLEENGFKVIKNRHNSRPNQFVMSLFFLLGIKKRSGILNRVLEVGFLPLTWVVNIFKMGDQVEIWCVKK